MSFIRSLFGGGDDRQKRETARLRALEQTRLAEQKEKEALATREAAELKFATEAGRKRRLRRGAGPQTIFTSPLGITGGGAIESKTLLGV